MKWERFLPWLEEHDIQIFFGMFFLLFLLWLYGL